MPDEQRDPRPIWLVQLEDLVEALKAEQAKDRDLLQGIKHLGWQLLKQMEVAGELPLGKRVEREVARDAHWFAQHVERSFRNFSEEARNIKEMLEHAFEGEDFWRGREGYEEEEDDPRG